MFTTADAELLIRHTPAALERVRQTTSGSLLTIERINALSVRLTEATSSSKPAAVLSMRDRAASPRYGVTLSAFPRTYTSATVTMKRRSVLRRVLQMLL